MYAADDVLKQESSMPTVLISGPYRLSFVSFDCKEPIHVHIRRDRNEAKFWLDPVEMAFNRGFSNKELGEIERIIIDNDRAIWDKWQEHCGGTTG